MGERNRLDVGEGVRGQAVDGEWVMFPGGELEGRPPKALCQQCRERKARFRFRGVVRADRSHTLCFQCYRAELDRCRAQRLPPSPLARRLAGAIVQFPEASANPVYAELTARRRHAQMAARHALDPDGGDYPAASSPFVVGE